MSRSLGRKARLLTYPEVPLSSTLAHTFGGFEKVAGDIVNVGPKRSLTRLPERSDVVSEKLCDDLLAYLKPTLERHKGCTLLDLHPGASLWSSKLHDVVKPRRHILIEPDLNYYNPFIKPLLDRPGSTYRHVVLDNDDQRITYLSRYSSIFSNPDFFPQRSGSVNHDDDYGRLEIDPSILITGNLHRLLWKSIHMGNDTEARMMHQIAWSVLGLDNFHSCGRARMLWWCSNDLQQKIFYDNSAKAKQIFSLGLHLCGNITKVAGVTPFPSNDDPNLSCASTIQRSFNAAVQQNMKREGIRLPPKRTLESEKPLSPTPIDARTYSPIFPLHVGNGELETAIGNLRKRIDRIKSHQVGYRSGKSRTERAEVIKDLHDSCAFPQLKESDLFLSRWKQSALDDNNVSARKRCLVSADAILQIIRLEASYKELEEQTPDNKKLAKLRGEITKLNTIMLALIDSNESYGTAIRHIVSQQVLTFINPADFPTDGRRMEPLKIEPEEIWPQHPLMLLDIMPSNIDMRVPGIEENPAKVCQTLRIIMRYLGVGRKTSIPDMIGGLAPNAAADLIPMIPSLTDPRKGGRLDPANLLGRDLTREMLVELVKAWYEWPFRPGDLEFAMEAQYTDPGVEMAGPIETEKNGNRKASQEDETEIGGDGITAL